MPRLRTALVLLLLAGATRSALAGLPSNVTFELGGAYERLGINGAIHVGGGGFVGARVPLRPWVNLGAELGLGAHAVDPDGWSASARTEGNGPMLVTVMSTVQFTVPVQSGLAPFAVSQTGVALLRTGDYRVYYPWNSVPLGYRHVDEYAFCSAIGVGLRGTWPRPAPGFELSLRLMMLAGEEPTTVFAPRLSLTY